MEEHMTKEELLDLKRALRSLIDIEQDRKDYSNLFNKLNKWYD